MDKEFRFDWLSGEPAQEIGGDIIPTAWQREF